MALVQCCGEPALVSDLKTCCALSWPRRHVIRESGEVGEAENTRARVFSWVTPESPLQSDHMGSKIKGVSLEVAPCFSRANALRREW